MHGWCGGCLLLDLIALNTVAEFQKGKQSGLRGSRSTRTSTRVQKATQAFFKRFHKSHRDRSQDEMERRETLARLRGNAFSSPVT